MAIARTLISVLLFGIITAVGAGYFAQRFDTLVAEKNLNRTGLQMASTLRARFEKYDALMLSTRAFLLATRSPYNEWSSYSSALALTKRYPGLYELALIGQPQGHSQNAACPIQEVSPDTLAPSWIGYDVCQNPLAMALLAEATRTQEIVLAGQASVGSGPSSKTLVGLYLAAGKLGWIEAHVDVSELLNDVTPRAASMSVLVYDEPHLAKATLLYHMNEPSPRYILFQTPVEVADGYWYLTITEPIPIGVLPIAAVLATVIITLLIAMLVLRSYRERVRVEQTAREVGEKYAASELRLSGILYNVNDGIFRVRGDWSLDFVNGTLAKQFGYHTAAQMKSQCPKLMFQDPQAGRVLMERLAAGEKCHQEEMNMVRVDGSQFIGLLSASSVRTTPGKMEFFDGAITDITVRKQQEQRIHELAYFDSVTKLPNRQNLYDSLDRYLAHAKRNQHVLAVMFIDLDRFKLVNDTLGHSVGDELLRSVASRLTSAVRTEDIVARQGGDEFVVLMPHVGSTDEVDNIADRIIRLVGQSYEIGEHEVHTSPSIGITVYPEHGADRETLLRHADIAMFEAKNAGRNTYRFYAPEMQTLATERLGIETDLGKALANKELLVEYEPVGTIPDLILQGAEAKLRWKHPRHGLLDAPSFMSVAAQTGLATDIGNWQLRMVCAHMEKFREMGVPPFPISVPVTEVQLKRGQVPQLIEALLRAHSIQPQWLRLRVSAKTLEVNATETRTALGALRKIGIKIGLLDFNLDHASVGLLQSLQIDEVVTHEKLMLLVPEDHNKKSVVEGVLTALMGRGIPAILKGVDNAAQVSFLTTQKATGVQGAYFSPILPAAKLAEFAVHSLGDKSAPAQKRAKA